MVSVIYIGLTLLSLFGINITLTSYNFGTVSINYGHFNKALTNYSIPVINSLECYTFLRWSNEIPLFPVALLVLDYLSAKSMSCYVTSVGTISSPCGLQKSDSTYLKLLFFRKRWPCSYSENGMKSGIFYSYRIRLALLISPTST